MEYKGIYEYSPLSLFTCILMAEILYQKRMCLYTTWRRGRIAKRNIQCYKIIAYSFNDNRTNHGYNLGISNDMYIHFFTPFVGKDTCAGDTIFSVSLDNVSYSTAEKRKVDQQGVHAYERKRDALKLICGAQEIVVKAIIPKGAIYWKGYIMNDYDSITGKHFIYDSIASSAMILGPIAKPLESFVNKNGYRIYDPDVAGIVTKAWNSGHKVMKIKNG